MTYYYNKIPLIKTSEAFGVPFCQQQEWSSRTTDEDNFIVDSIWFTSLLIISVSISPSSTRVFFASNAYGCLKRARRVFCLLVS